MRNSSSFISTPASNRRLSHSGFTLVEMMIAMFIMGILTTIVSQAIKTSVVNKKKMANKITAQAVMYDTIRIVKRDVEKAFHYQDVFYQIEKNSIEELNKELKKQKPQNGAQPAPPIEVPKAPIQFTQFIGEENQMHFTSLNNFRTRFNVQESDQMEVGYLIDSCETKTKGESTKCLYRRWSPYIDDDVEKGGRRMVVVEHISAFILEYRSNEDNADWVTEWKSNNRGRADQRNKFPHLVRMTLEIHNEDDPSAKKIREVVVFQIHFPNNILYFVPEKTTNATTNETKATN